MESADRASDAEQSARSYSMTAECQPVKEEPEWGECGVSAAAAAEGLYAGHEIKVEVVLGPELIQMQDVAFSMTSALSIVEEDLLQLKLAGGAEAAPECTHSRPGECPLCSTCHKHQFKLRSCFVRLERFPIVDLHHNIHTCKTCLMTFDCESSLRNHSCTNAVQESNFNNVCSETAKTQFKCELYGKQYVQKGHIIRHPAAHNIKPVDKKLVPYFSKDDKFANTEVFSYSDNVSETQFKNQSALTIHTGERPGPHICDVCSKVFLQKQHLIRHIRKLHRDDIDDMTDKYICDLCNKWFRNRSQLTSHLQVHTGEKPFTCDVCNKQFRQSSHLAIHRWIHTGEKPYCCSVCKKQFTQKHYLARHIQMHTKEKLFTCDVCNEQFAWKAHWFRHVTRMHKGEKSYSCNICEKKLGNKSHLFKHMKIHTSEKPFTCDVCKKHFTLRSTLTTHRRIHTGEKPFTCDVCKKQFTVSGTLTKHRRIHTGEKPYSCSVCNKQFTQKQSLTDHMKKQHG